MRDFNQYAIRQPDTVSPGRILLLRAALYHELVERGEMSELQAFESLAPDFWTLVHPLCDCARDIYDRMERLYPHVPPKKRWPK